MTAISNTYSYSSHLTALQLLSGVKARNDKSGANGVGAISDPTSASLSASALTQIKKPNDATAFLVSQAFAGTASSVRKDLLAQFYDKGLAQEFVTADNKWLAQTDPSGKPIPPEMAHLSAVVDVINAHREDFSPDEFTLTVSMPDGGSGVITIQSAAMMSADIFKRQVDTKQADYDAAAAAKEEKPDPDAAKLDALSQAMQNLSQNGDDVAGDGPTDAKTAYAILTKKLFFDNEDDPNAADERKSTGEAPPLTTRVETSSALPADNS